MVHGTQRARHPQLLRQIVLGRGDATIETLAASLGVSAKTVRRDIAGLRELGCAIEERIAAGGLKTYQLASHHIDQVGFTYDEAFSLMLCRAGTDQFAGTLIGDASKSAFEKVRVALAGDHEDYFDRIAPWLHRTAGYGQYDQHRDIIDALTIGIEDSKATFISYQSARSTEPVTYDIHPYGLAEHHGALYVVGHSCHHDEIRTWKVDRMQFAEVTRFPFIRPADFDLGKHFEGAFAVITGQDPITVRIRFRGPAARYAAERKINATQTVTPGPAGSTDLTVTLTSTIEIKSYILSFGPDAEVLAPQSLRDEIAEELAEASAQYEIGNETKTENPNHQRHEGINQ